MLHSRIGSWPYPQTLDWGGKACQGQTPSLLLKGVTFRRKKFYNIGYSQAVYGIIYTRNMLIVQATGLNVVKHFRAVICECSWKARFFVPGKSFQPSLIFEGKARSQP